MNFSAANGCTNFDEIFPLFYTCIRGDRLLESVVPILKLFGGEKLFIKWVHLNQKFCNGNPGSRVGARGVGALGKTNLGHPILFLLTSTHFGGPGGME